MKKMFVLIAGILFLALMYKVVIAQQVDEDFSLNVELMNVIGDTYIVTKCKPKSSLAVAVEIEYYCSEDIVPGTLDAKICYPVRFRTFGEEQSCCYKQ